MGMAGIVRYRWRNNHWEFILNGKFLESCNDNELSQVIFDYENEGYFVKRGI